MKSIEEKVEEYYKRILDQMGVRHYGKTEQINAAVTKALRDSTSKSGGVGINYPDIQLILEDGNARRIPVMIEAKGSKNKLENNIFIRYLGLVENRDLLRYKIEINARINIAKQMVFYY